jgi:hypothetical protein
MKLRHRFTYVKSLLRTCICAVCSARSVLAEPLPIQALFGGGPGPLRTQSFRVRHCCCHLDSVVALPGCFEVANFGEASVRKGPEADTGAWRLTERSASVNASLGPVRACGTLECPDLNVPLIRIANGKNEIGKRAAVIARDRFYKLTAVRQRLARHGRGAPNCKRWNTLISWCRKDEGITGRASLLCLKFSRSAAAISRPRPGL